MLESIWWISLFSLQRSLSSEVEAKRMEVGDPQDGGCLAWAIVFASFMVSFLQVPTNFSFLQVLNFFLANCWRRWWAERAAEQVLQRSQKLNMISQFMRQTSAGYSWLICWKLQTKTFPGWIPGQFWTFAAFTCRPLWRWSCRGNSHLQHNDPPHPGKVPFPFLFDFDYFVLDQHHPYKLTCCSGPLAAALVLRLGHRVTTMLGVFLASAGIQVLSKAILGLIFKHFSGLLIAGLYIESGPTLKNILVVHVSVGGLVGLGFGLMYLPAMDIVPHYFDRRCGGNHFQVHVKTCQNMSKHIILAINNFCCRLGLATGLAAAGSGVGQVE